MAILIKVFEFILENWIIFTFIAVVIIAIVIASKIINDKEKFNKELSILKRDFLSIFDKHLNREKEMVRSSLDVRLSSLNIIGYSQASYSTKNLIIEDNNEENIIEPEAILSLKTILTQTDFLQKNHWDSFI